MQSLYLDWLRRVNPKYAVDQETLVWAVGEGLNQSINQTISRKIKLTFSSVRMAYFANTGNC